MTNFYTLPVEDQAMLVLVTLLEDTIHGKRTFASIEHPVSELFQHLSSAFDVPEQEVRIVADAVARAGIRMLPGYVEEVPNADAGTDGDAA